MPPKPQVFKSPDGKEFSTRAEWRDYMMATFYTFKDKKNLTEPLIKRPGDIDGQMFDIGDCENSTLVIMDNCEQVQIDQVKNCRIFIGACASSIFIRNCENCVFYTSCRQLRLREVVNSTFYIYSMSEVHIEYSNALKFAPFNGGYPEHAAHLRTANLDPAHNLWYDIFDHNDPQKSKGNWKLLPLDEYEAPWFPAGEPCELAVKLTPAGSVIRTDQAPDGGSSQAGSNEQTYSIQQMIADAEALKTTSAPPVPPAAAAAVVSSAPVPQVAPVASAAKASPVAPSAASAYKGEDTSIPATSVSHLLSGDNIEVVAAIAAYANIKSAEDLTKIASIDFSAIQADGNTLTLADLAATYSFTQLWEVEKITVCASGQVAWAVFWVANDAALSHLTKTSAIFVRHGDSWKIAHAHASSPSTLDFAKISLAVNGG